MAQEWNIKTRAEMCGKCETPFIDKQIYCGALIFGEEGYARQDFCEQCWASRDEKIQPYSMWQSVFKMPPDKPEEALTKETTESLLRKMMEDNDPSQNNVRYILAVMLERKRVFIERDVQTNDAEETTRIYEHRKTGETFVIPDPHLQLDQLEDTQEQVIIMLGGTPPGMKAAEPETDDEDPTPADQPDA